MSGIFGVRVANRSIMYSTHSATWLATISQPLSEKFGGGLTLSRVGNTVCWGYDGQSAFVELASDGRLKATFVDVTRVDAVSGQAAAAAYRSRATYALTAAGGRRMVGDLVDFFSGVREPVFTFVDAVGR